MEDISLHILDIAENAITAGATLIEIRITEDTAKDLLTVEIKDNGKGMSEEHVKKVLDPFFTSRTTRKVGLGISLLAQSAREAAGDISIESAEGKGTLIAAYFKNSHIDLKPLGDLAGTFSVLVIGNPDLDFVFLHNSDNSVVSFDTRQIRDEIGGLPFNTPEVMSAIRAHLLKSFSDKG